MLKIIQNEFRNKNSFLFIISLRNGKQECNLKTTREMISSSFTIRLRPDLLLNK